MSDIAEFFRTVLVICAIVFLVIVVSFCAIAPIQYFMATHDKIIYNKKYHVNYSVSDYFWSEGAIIATLNVPNKRLTVKLSRG